MIRGVFLKQSIHIAAAFVGLIVGAGFASGQEILQYFTSHGWKSMYGILFAIILFSFLGSQIAIVGQRLQATSHKEVIRHIAGDYLGIIIDIFLIFLLFGVTIVMFAGSGAMFEQVFHIPSIYGQIFLVLLTIFTLMLNIKKILLVLAAIIPYFIVITVIIALYAIFTIDSSFAEQHAIALKQPGISAYWILSTILYVSYNIALSVPMLAVLGGTATQTLTASRGGLLGGLLLGMLILLINTAMLVKINIISGTALPMLALGAAFHPLIGILLAIIMMLKMYTTAVGCLYAFCARFVAPTQKNFKWFVAISSFFAFCASFAGFTTLVGKLYSIMGYIGLLLIFIILKYTLTKSRSVRS